MLLEELPPHTRRKELEDKLTSQDSGTTSAYAEKSSCGDRRAEGARNYLRIRGEKNRASHRILQSLELPPHTRRKAHTYLINFALFGTTSAYAEKRTARLNPLSITRNYLRIRGEKLAMKNNSSACKELPPHTRRKG
ncbi:Hypothetical protein Cul210932_1845 [Corynebacterium ulcerans]|nr:Hypothetical protein Cul210932_1845 [Corynebacterium ulcerans]